MMLMRTLLAFLMTSSIVLAFPVPKDAGPCVTIRITWREGSRNWDFEGLDGLQWTLIGFSDKQSVERWIKENTGCRVKFQD